MSAVEKAADTNKIGANYSTVPLCKALHSGTQETANETRSATLRTSASGPRDLKRAGCERVGLRFAVFVVHRLFAIDPDRELGQQKSA